MSFKFIRTNYVYTILFVSIVIFIVSLSFLHYTHYQTEYLIHYDAWRFFEKLRTDAPLESYIFHGVHTFVIPNVLFYLDTLWADGNLKFFHAINFFSTGIFFIFLWRIIYKHHKSKLTSTTIAIIGANIWLGMSNSVTFAYPVVEVLSTYTLLSISIIALTSEGLLHNRFDTRYAFNALFFVVASIIGFLSLEVFLSVIFVFFIEASYRKRYLSVILSGLLLVVLSGFYLYFQAGLLLSSKSGGSVNIASAVYNFLFLLGGQVHFLFMSLGASKGAAGSLSILFAVIELYYIGYMVNLIVRCKVDITKLHRFAAYIILFSVSCVASAVLLRYSNHKIDFPVTRYTTYSTMLSLGVLLFSYVNLTKWSEFSNNKNKYFSIFMISLLALYSVLDGPLVNDKYPSKHFYLERLEMPLYALVPGSERRLGPSSSTEGLKERARLHSYMKEQGLSIFSDPGVSFVGKIFPFESFVGLENVDGCVIHKTSKYIRENHSVMSTRISNPHKAGYYFLLDAEDNVRSYSLPTSLLFGSDSYLALFVADNNYVSNLHSPRIVYANIDKWTYSECTFILRSKGFEKKSISRKQFFVGKEGEVQTFRNGKITLPGYKLETGVHLLQVENKGAFENAEHAEIVVTITDNERKYRVYRHSFHSHTEDGFENILLDIKKSGSYTINVSFVNDSVNSSMKEDRNAFIKRISLRKFKDKPNGIPWNRDGNLVIKDKTIFVVNNINTREINFSLDNNDQYELCVGLKQNEMPVCKVFGPSLGVGGLRNYHWKLKQSMLITSLAIKPLSGDNKFSIGHIRLK
ncbi:MAG: hypothetical protein DIZ80_17430 [endosymbiont of Galathealinum brachiosum]|uniref:Uncharacterized protein n=1 Tax=endosymbiont of Galathealinum brachiosum TaxID=2200906 RepID=A0A370D731_9GAMM|nr:MAG: hypothetical protein DIZ80_17430 [endosymbiont of Galathealinum brachiosum]